MGQALYRKYRSKSLAELVGQEHITTALHNALQHGMVSHAYLFTGPRGVGKTSTARILAHQVNNLPYDENATHMDIIEIDAASNRRIEEIRDLRERVHVAPTSAKYKVYIIDEVHMLTKEAFNALLKTLEEPPAHVIFILATTESHKLPETIISRTQRYSFRPVEEQAVVNHLLSIAHDEHIDISNDALTLIARHGDGSFRDSISLLDQVRTIGGHIDIAQVNTMLGVAPLEAITVLWDALESRSSKDVSQQLQNMHSSGFEAGQIARQVTAYFRTKLLNDYSDPQRLMHALHTLLEVPTSHDSETALELALLAMTFDRQVAEKSPTPPITSVQTAATVKPKSVEPPEIKIITKAPAHKSVDTVVQTEQPAVNTVNVTLGPELWSAVLALLQEKYKTLYSVMRMAEAEFGNDKLTIYFKFPFHKRRAEEPKNKQILLDALKQHTGGAVGLVLTVHETSTPQLVPTPSVQPSTPQVTPPIVTPPESITAVFGGGEVLES